MKKIKKKKKSSSSKVNLFFGILIVVLLVFFFKNKVLDYVYFHYYEFSSNKNPEKIYIPLSYSVVGVDVSRYQQKMDWEKLQVINHVSDTLQLDFVIAKATEGTFYQDPLYRFHVQQSQNQEDIIFGAYHYFLPNNDALTQAKHFLATADLREGNLVPIVDVEEKRGQSNKVIQQKVLEFCDYIEQEIGQKPIIYSNKHFLINTLGEKFKNYPIWVAHYHEKAIDLPTGWKWKMWQLSDEGSTFATISKIDINVFNGSKNQLKNLCIK